MPCSVMSSPSQNGEHRASRHGRQHRYCQQQVAADAKAEAGDNLCPRACRQIENADLTQRLQYRHGDGDIVGVALDFLLTARLALDPFQRRHNGHQQLKDDGRGDVGVDAVGDDAEVCHRAARQQVHHLDQVAGAAAAFKDLPQHIAVNANHRHMRRELVDDQDEQREQQLVPHIWQTPGVTQCLNHQTLSSSLLRLRARGRA